MPGILYHNMEIAADYVHIDDYNHDKDEQASQANATSNLTHGEQDDVEHTPCKIDKIWDSSFLGEALHRSGVFFGSRNISYE